MSHDTRDYASLMRERGFRVTPQRQLILDAVCEGEGHTTVEEIYERVQTKSPAISQATVYRTLDFLSELGLVTSAHIGRRQMVYEIAGEHPHHHLVCQVCGKVEEIGHELVKAFFDQIEHEHQFVVEMNHLMLTGLCQDCHHT